MTDITPIGAAQATRLVAEREVRSRLRSKSFVISWAILLVLVLGGVIASGIASQSPSQPKVAAVGAAIAVAQQTHALDVTESTDRADAERLLREGDVDAAIVPSDTSPGVTVIALDEEPSEVVAALAVAPKVTLLDPSDSDPLLAYFVAIAFGIVFFMSALTFGQMIAQSVVEEKQTRIVEILMTAVPVRALLAGKIIGNSILAFVQIASIALLACVVLLATGQDILLAGIGAPIIWFVVFFVVGFIMLAALYSATAALVSRQEDLAGAVSPVTMLVMVPYFLIIFLHDNPVVLTVMSYVPFSAPVGMPMRIFLGDAQWWEPLLSLAVLLATTVGIVAIGSRVYENGLLRTGPRVTLREALFTR